MELENDGIIEKLENIFMPHMAKNKQKLKNESNQYIHYTSAMFDAFFDTLTNKGISDAGSRIEISGIPLRT